ncbi:MAG: hypothetical protein B7Y39_12450 [Bdellovibrio sp. 28-41-41]|nr:MAG: hypothetical protein B7Y39_12450 [Bdellovibrio sp. 28-41-41]
MEKIYSANLVYKSYLEFIFSKVKQKNVVAVPFVFYFFFFFLNLSGKTIFLSIENGKFKPVSFDMIVAQLEYLAIYIPILFILYLIFASGMWFQKFTIRQNKIIDLFPTEKEFSLSDIARVVLFSPNLGQIILQPASSKLTHTVYWHGKNEKDWLEFIGKIESIKPSIKDKIYVKKSKWGSGEIKQSTVTDSYSEILKIYS